MAQQRGVRQRNCCRALANRNFKQQLFSLVIRRRAFGVAAMVLVVCENGIQASFFLVSVRSSRIVATLHITFSWLQLPIG